MNKLKANPERIKLWAEQTKCLSCRHREKEGHILPKGKFFPSVKWLFHYEDTHGWSHEDVASWIFQSVYQDKDGTSALRLNNQWAFKDNMEKGKS